MKTWHIHIKGIVQGVGFRPFVYQMAIEDGLSGWVNNGTSGVHIELNAGEKSAKDFLQKLLRQPPKLARITSSSIYKVKDMEFTGLRIIRSKEHEDETCIIPPDYAVCSQCIQEMRDPDNRRFGYAFITCTDCGPRYSIIDKLPYDRQNTNMSKYQMCPKCEEEYADPNDRRYHSQTNSCKDCGINMQLFSSDGQQIAVAQGQIIRRAVDLLKAGNIIAIKGIGGFLIIADAKNDLTIRKLRERKHRPEKPFAVMYPSLLLAERDLSITEVERKALLSPYAPIVLLKCRRQDVVSKYVAPRLNNLGVMLPYTPLFQQLLDDFGSPIVATSGNISGSSIVIDDSDVFELLEHVVDFILTNDRPINIAQDDSVIRFTPLFQKKIILRRSRGIAPNCIFASPSDGVQSCLALGANMKSTFSITHKGNILTSQYLGNLDDYRSLLSFERTISNLIRIAKVNVSKVIVDKHPGYASTQWGKDFATQKRCDIETIQHHKAHFAAIISESGATTDTPILGVIWDGTGYGEDGNIWGGEFFVFDEGDFERFFHFAYFPVLLGDKMSLEPRLSAFSLTGGAEILRGQFADREWKLYLKLLDNHKPVLTSSVGRVFDAVASILGLLSKSEFEAQAAILLEQAAQNWIDKHGISTPDCYDAVLLSDGTVCSSTIIDGILEDIRRQEPIEKIAYKFHETLVLLISRIARKGEVKRVAFSGGVFQNAVLVDLIHSRMGDEYRLYFHEQLSSGDENISFGQITYHKLMTEFNSKIKNKLSCV